MDRMAIDRAATRISHEIIERNEGVENVVLIGIQRRGVIFANRIAEKISQVEGKRVPVGILDITLYRDDFFMLTKHPVINGTYIDFSIEGKIIVMVDDVLFTGRTIRAGIEAIMEMGRPDAIQLAILVDRGHRELPIRADFVGKNLPTAKSEIVNVNVFEIDKKENVEIVKKEDVNA